jgi:hypothetical protein
MVTITIGLQFMVMIGSGTEVGDESNVKRKKK